MCFIITLSAFSVGAYAGNILELKDGSQLRLDRESGYILGIDGIVSTEELAGEFSVPVTVKAQDGNERTGNVASDDIVSASENDSLKAVIYGDVNRDGKVNAKDVSSMIRRSAGWNTDICTPACDVNADGAVNAKDISLILRKLAGWDIVLGDITYPAEEFEIDSTYKIVISENADDYEKESAELIAEALDAIYGTSLAKSRIISDTVNCENEIIVGSSTRQYSASERRKTEKFGYSYSIIRPGKIAICGNDSAATYEAAEKFLWDMFTYIDKCNYLGSKKIWNGSEYVTVKGSPVLTSGESYVFNVPEGERDLKLNGRDISEYTVVYAEGYEAAAKLFARDVERFSGDKLTVSDKSGGASTVYIGQNLSGGHDSSKYYIFTYGGENNRVYIDCYSAKQAVGAVRAFSLKFLEEYSADADVVISETYRSSTESNLLTEAAGDESQVADGVVYREIKYTDKHGMPVVAYALILDDGAGKLAMGTPGNEISISQNTASVQEEMESARGAGLNVIAGINADFFDLGGTNAPIGICVKDSTVMQSNINGRAWFAVLNDGTILTGAGKTSNSYEKDMRLAFGASHQLLSAGDIKDVGLGSEFATIRHPRTAMGYTEDGKVILLVIDGRQPELSNGASLIDTALILESLGCCGAVNLDGGGSSTMILSEDGTDTVKNSPSDGALRKIYNSVLVVLPE